VYTEFLWEKCFESDQEEEYEGEGRIIHEDGSLKNRF
jgi:hypothetical protein